MLKPSEQAYVTSWKFDCSKYGHYWHTACVGLQELDEEELNKIGSVPFAGSHRSPLKDTMTINSVTFAESHCLCSNILNLLLNLNLLLPTGRLGMSTDSAPFLGGLHLKNSKRELIPHPDLIHVSRIFTSVTPLSLSLRYLDSNIQKDDKSLSEFPSDQTHAVSFSLSASSDYRAQLAWGPRPQLQALLLKRREEPRSPLTRRLACTLQCKWSNQPF